MSTRGAQTVSFAFCLRTENAVKEAVHVTRHLNWDNQEVYFLVIGNWKCAAGWDRIFKTWIDYNGVPFSIVIRMPPPPPLFRIIGVRKFLKMGKCMVQK